MRILMVFASGRFTGGRLSMVRHALGLAERGCQVTVAVQADDSQLRQWSPQLARLISFREIADLPEADICLFDRVRLAKPLHRARPEPVVHFCQGFERTDLELRLAELEAQTAGWFTKFRKRNEFRKRLREIDDAYRLPTLKFVTHQHLADSIRLYYEQPSTLVPYGLPEGVFCPDDRRSEQKRTVLVVGPMTTGWKRIGDALRAVSLLKKNQPDVRLVRVAQEPMTDRERELGVTDLYLTMISPHKMAELYREADVLLLTSDFTEGFGLPALEAMACGLPCALTHIPSFRTFAPTADYACFVPVGQPEVMARRVEALLSSPTERQRLRRRGLEVAASYTWRRSVDSMEQSLLRACQALARQAA